MLLHFIEDNHDIIIIGAIILAVLILAVLIHHAARPVARKMESRIRHKKYISQDDFFESWKNDKKDFPGCYLVLIYDKKLIFNPMNYDDIYVGQSVHVRARVFSHLKGHGNGDVYYGLRSGCRVYVVIEKCSKKKLNKAEKELIEYFDATASLNMTKGGAARR